MEQPLLFHHRPFSVTIKIIGVLLLLTIGFAIIWFKYAPFEKEAIIFKNVTLQSGLHAYKGMTYGAYWGDFDGDGLPDLYVTNHLNEAKLFHNLGNGKFEDVTATHFNKEELGGDKHGAEWADFDNDGCLDLIQLTGAKRGVGEEPKRLFRNQSGRFEDVAEKLGVNNSFSRARIPLWCDFNRDGRLDLFQGADARLDDRTPPFVFMQGDKGFLPSLDTLVAKDRGMPFCFLYDLTGSGHPMLICRITSKTRAVREFDIAKLPAEELDLLPQTAFEDIAAADFDNAGHLDLFMARKDPPGRVAFGRPNDKEIIADMEIEKDQINRPTGFTFRTKGNLSIRVDPVEAHGMMSASQVFLGPKGSHPEEFSFSISNDSFKDLGLSPNKQGDTTGLYIGRISGDIWQVSLNVDKTALISGGYKEFRTALRITSTDNISDIKGIEDSVKTEEAPARLFINRNGQLVEESKKRGVFRRIVSGVNVVVGDFDNDMHVDVFVLASGEIGSHENLLLLNQGDGTFIPVKAAGGAAGNGTGVGDSVTAVDYDKDGFLDLLVASGGSMGRSLGIPCEDGGYTLYHNIGNNNHWIEIDLEGTTSNRDGIGAIVRVKAGGVTQMRLQDGGMHNRGQNYKRLHFGLAQNTKIDSIEVHWPSGTLQNLNNLTADQILKIRETGNQ